MIPGIPEGAAGSHLFDYLLRSFPQFPGFVIFSLLLYICFLLRSLFNLLYLQASILFLSIQFYPVFYPSPPSPFPLSYPYSFHHYPSPLYLLLFLFLFYPPPPLLLPSTLAPEVPYSVVRCLVTPSPCDDARMLRRGNN